MLNYPKKCCCKYSQRLANATYVPSGCLQTNTFVWEVFAASSNTPTLLYGKCLQRSSNTFVFARQLLPTLLSSPNQVVAHC